VVQRRKLRAIRTLLRNSDSSERMVRLEKQTLQLRLSHEIQRCNPFPFKFPFLIYDNLNYGKQERSSVKGRLAIIQHRVTCCIAAKAPVSGRPFATTIKFAPGKHASLRPNMLASNAPNSANMCRSSMLKALACKRPTLKVIFKS
jgi:hypothetical protein